MRLRPSSSDRWVNCAGSVALQELYPQDDSPEAREGTAAHWYASEAFWGRHPTLGATAPNGHPIDAEMIEHGDAYVRAVGAVVATFPATATFRVEQTLAAPTLVNPENGGTPDAFVLCTTSKRLAVFDYKYGHRYVDPYHNWQLINYVACIWESYSLTFNDVAEMGVTLSVYQPRNYSKDGASRTWTTNGRTLWVLIDRLKSCAAEALKPGAATRTGDWCRDCDARHACPAFASVAARCMDEGGASVPQDLPPQALGQELSRLHLAQARIKARIDGLEAQAMGAIKARTLVPGWEIGYTNTRTRWTVPRDDVLAVGDAMGVDLRHPDPLTPAQAKTKGLDATVINAYSIKPPGAAKLVASDPNAAAKAFSE